MQRILWLITVCGALLAFLTLGVAMTENSAPRQAAAAGIALCFAVIPYVLSRAMAELNLLPSQETFAAGAAVSTSAEDVSTPTEDVSTPTEDGTSGNKRLFDTRRF